MATTITAAPAADEPDEGNTAEPSTDTAGCQRYSSPAPALTRTELQAILTELPREADRQVVRFLVETGLRCGELGELRWKAAVPVSETTTP